MNNKPAHNRIAILLPDLRFGGAERVAVNLANNFAERGYEIDMVLLNARGEFLAELNPLVNIFNLDAPRLRNALYPLIKYLKMRTPHSCLASMWPLTTIAILANLLSLTKTKVIVSEHTVWSKSNLFKNTLTRIAIKLSTRLTFPLASGIVCVSEGAANDLSDISGVERKKIKVIYNPIIKTNLTKNTLARSPLEWWNGTHKKVLAVSALIPEKDYKTLLDAFRITISSTYAKLLILGDGECREEIENTISDYKLKEHVFLGGFVTDPHPYYKRADLFVLSSQVEGFGNVLVEALHAGTPIVSTDCPHGPREILCDGKFGALVPVANPTQLAKAISSALSNKHEASSLVRRSLDFSIAKISTQYLKILSN